MDLKTALEQAFDEGSQSPYDLRDSIVQELLKQVPSASYPTMSQKYLKSMYNCLPLPIIEILKSTPCYLSGGSLLKLLVDVSGDQWNDSDWDIFCDQANFKQLSCYNKLLKVLKSDYEDKNWGNYVYNIPHKAIPGFKIRPDLNINVIVGDFKTVASIVNTFDIRLLQMALWIQDKKLYFFTYNKAWEDFNRNVLILNDASIHSTSKTHNRVKKYITRGFRDQTGLIESPIFEMPPSKDNEVDYGTTIKINL